MSGIKHVKRDLHVWKCACARDWVLAVGGDGYVCEYVCEGKRERKREREKKKE